MTYKDALEFVKKNNFRIGSVDEKGFVVSHLLIVPADNKKREVYLSNFINSPHNMLDSSALDGQEVEVWAVDTSHIDRANVLFYNKLA